MPRASRSAPTLALAALTLAGLCFAAAPASAQSPDYSVNAVRVLQILEGSPGVGERPVTVRTVIGVTGPNSPAQQVDALMRVFVDGVEAADSPLYSNNGPILVEGNSSIGQAGTMLNFTYIPPISNDVVFEVQLNPPGPNFVPEANLANNVGSSTSLSFREQELLTLMYSPIDYREGGGSVPNLPDPELIKPGVGDAFVQGIYPGGVIEYRRTAAPSKLWTGSLSGSGSSLNSSLNTDLLLTSPQPDYIYGWVPGGLPYNGMAFINGKASMGNTEPIRYQRTYAHELGHNFGQSHNGFASNAWGEDVERHLFVPQALKKIKPNNLNDIMVAGQITSSAWVNVGILNQFYNHPNLALPSTDSDAADSAPSGPGPHLLVSGTWDRQTGTITLDPVIEVQADEGSRPAPAPLTDLVVRGLAGGDLVGVHPLTARSSGDDGGCGDGHGGAGDSADHVDPIVPFGVLVPAIGVDGRRLQGLSLVGVGGHPATPVTLQASAHAPDVRVLSPRTGDVTGASVHLAWEASDADGDALFSTVRYVPDGGRHAVPLLVNSSATELDVDLRGLPHFVPGQGHFELLVSDGFRTARARSAGLQGPGAYAGALGGSPPFVDIYHPDDGTSAQKGSSLILHSSGWDLEDDALTGSSISWSSDLDGFLGEGRRFLVDDLSVGVHQITVTATDSGGQQTTATHVLTVTDRDLPDLPGEVCATDLGFGGPGASTLELCGGDLTTGGSATLSLTGAPASAPAFLVLGAVNGPTPLKGGTLVPVPWVAILDFTTDGAGAVTVPGVLGLGGAPLPVLLQFVLVDGTQPQGFGFSNAIEALF